MLLPIRCMTITKILTRPFCFLVVDTADKVFVESIAVVRFQL